MEHTVIVLWQVIRSAVACRLGGLQVSDKLTKFMWNPVLNKNSYTTSFASF